MSYVPSERHVCQECGKTFSLPPGKGSRNWCSAGCRRAWIEARPLPHCGECGREFFPTQEKARYCGYDCRQAAQYRRQVARVGMLKVPKPDPRPCPECGKVFAPCRTTHQYCCYGCARKARKAGVMLLPRRGEREQDPAKEKAVARILDQIALLLRHNQEARNRFFRLCSKAYNNIEKRNI